MERDVRRVCVAGQRWPYGFDFDSWRQYGQWKHYRNHWAVVDGSG